MDLQQFQRIRSRADELFLGGKLKGALDAYSSIRGYAKSDPKFLMRLGDIQRRLGNDAAAVVEYIDAVRAYAKDGFIVKAIAVCKLVLSIDPSRTDIEKGLAKLYSQRDEPQAAPPAFTGAVPEDGAYETDASLEAAGEAAPIEAEVIESIEPAEEAAVSGGIDVEFGEDFGDAEVVREALRAAAAEAEAVSDGGRLRTPLFSDLTAIELAEVISRLKTRSLGMGEYVYRSGEIGHSIFIVVSGAAEEIGRTKYGEEIKCAAHMDGDFFGEDAYFSGLQRKTDLVAVTDLELLEIEKEEMEKIASVYPHVNAVLEDFYKERVLDRVLATSKVFRHLAAADRRGLLELAEITHRAAGDDVVREGVADDEKMYIIASGAAEVWKRGAAGAKTQLARLLTSDYFGEVALMLSRPRTATVTALSPLDLIVFSRQSLSGVFARYPIVRKVLENMAKKHLGESGNP